MSISVASHPRARRPGIVAPLRGLIGAALALEGRRAGAVAVLLTDDRALRDLNRRWRGIDRATDVLSFVYQVHRDGRIDGDLAISLQRMAAQARRYRVSPGRELARLVVHGALHLAGLDHVGAAERRRMRRREHQALRAGAPGIRALERSLAGG
jgi:probable rRNA maturation factor